MRGHIWKDVAINPLPREFRPDLDEPDRKRPRERYLFISSIPSSLEIKTLSEKSRITN